MVGIGMGGMDIVGSSGMAGESPVGFCSVIPMFTPPDVSSLDRVGNTKSESLSLGLGAFLPPMVFCVVSLGFETALVGPSSTAFASRCFATSCRFERNFAPAKPKNKMAIATNPPTIKFCFSFRFRFSCTIRAVLADTVSTGRSVPKVLPIGCANDD